MNHRSNGVHDDRSGDKPGSAGGGFGRNLQEQPADDEAAQRRNERSEGQSKLPGPWQTVALAQANNCEAHTEVDEQFGGRGLAGALMRVALADSIRRNLTAVPVCPLFARHLKAHGDEFVAAGGAFRRPNRDDVALVTRVARARRDGT